MENNELNKRVQDLINYLDKNRVIDKSAYFIFNGMSQQEWNVLASVMLNKGFMKKHETKAGHYLITPEGNLLIGDRYLKQVQEHTDLQRKKEERERKETEKLHSDLINSVRQRKAFWPVLIISLILHLCTITGLIIKFTEKPVVQKQYIPVDSKGKIYENLNKN